ncbi:sensor histidine kinase [Actinokineospora sp.]|uniref:sensor histidine kinase n=1 Tax=Actinokineospora sp. TaxID=1872133 RepID=UPI00403835F1
MSEPHLVPRWSRGRGLAQWPLRRWLALAVGLLVAFSAGAIVAGAAVITNLTVARESLVDRIDPALRQALRLDVALLDQQTGLRGYALSGRDDFLAPYVEGVQREQAAAGRLRELLGDRSELADLDGVLSEAVQWRAEFAEPSIERIRTSGPTGTQDTGGKARFDRVRAAVDSLHAALEATRVEGRAALGDAADLVVVVCLTIAALLVIVFAAVIIALRAAVIGPLGRLAGQVRRVADGDFQYSLLVAGPREVTELSGDVDSMRRRILDELAGQREINAELDSRTEDLKRSNAELEQFAYVASHDLQEPLRKIASFCQLLERRYKGQLDERADQYIGFAVDGAKRMQILINDLLAFSRVGRVPREAELIDSADLVAQAAANLGPTVEESAAVIETGPLPTVRGESVLLTAVFQNLIGNAVKFRAEAAPRVRVEAERVAEDWLYSVTDNGIGIETEFAERVFVIFQRLHGKDTYPGTGIGLAMCRKIIEYHGGRIWLDTEYGGPGTRFRFTLPVPDTLGDNDEKAEGSS